MTPQTLTTENDYQAAPVGTVVINHGGYAWQKIEHNETPTETLSLWRSTEPDISPFPPNLMADLGSCAVIYTPTQAEPTASELTEEPKRVYVTEADVEELNNAPFGAIVKDTDGDLWVKTNHGWAHGGNRNSLPMIHAPYTLIHTPPSDLANL